MENYLKIGEVAKQFKITTRTLRFYEENGLLKPCKIDENKYRLYSKEQIDELRKILFLKEVGLDLQSIKEYLTSNTDKRKQILEKFNKNADVCATMCKEIIKNENFDLENIENIVYYGNQVRRKNLKDLCGVWVLDGIYQNLRDAQVHKGKIDAFTPYSFLAFDESGNSPWFYSADQQKIYFNTFYLPTSEVYQIKGDQLFVKISNPKQHIFVEEQNSINKPHLLLFKLYSKNFEDYKKFLKQDNFDEKQIFDKNLVGCWSLCGTSKSFLNEDFSPLNSQSLLLAKNNFSATIYNNKSTRELLWTKSYLFDKKAKQKMEYKIKDSLLILQNKTTTYTFTGHLTNYLVFQKIDFNNLQ